MRPERRWRSTRSSSTKTPRLHAFRRNLAMAKNHFANVLSNAGDLAAGDREYRACLEIYQKLIDEDPTAYDYHDLLGNAYADMAMNLLWEDKPEQAEAECRKAVAEFEKSAARNSSIEADAAVPAWCLNVLGDAVRKSGRAAEALKVYDRAVASQERHFKLDSGMRANPYALSASKWRRALTLIDLSDHAGAAVDTRRALQVIEGLPSRSGALLFDAACCHAVLAGLAGRAGSGVSAAEGDAEAAKAMECLRRAADLGVRSPTCSAPVRPRLNPQPCRLQEVNGRV